MCRAPGAACAECRVLARTAAMDRHEGAGAVATTGSVNFYLRDEGRSLLMDEEEGGEGEGCGEASWDDGCKLNCAGLGEGLGGAMVRSILKSTGLTVLRRQSLGRSSRMHHPRGQNLKEPDRLASMAPLPCKPQHAAKASRSLAEAGLVIGMRTGLAMCDASSAPAKEVAEVDSHRWTFDGAVDIAARSRGHCSFVRCLLELQRNVQLDAEGEALDAGLAKSCSAFVAGNYLGGRADEMFCLLTSFLCNAVVFVEWGRFLDTAFEDPLANEEGFLVPYLDEVWRRFCRLSHALQHIFAALDQLVPLHRLPTVKALVQEHVRRRCFSSEAAWRNALLTRGNAGHPILSEIRHTFGFERIT